MKIYIKSFAILLVISFSTLNAQHSFFTFPIADSTNNINLNGEYKIETSSIQNDLSNKFIYGGKIDSKIKNNSFSTHKKDNTIEIGAIGNLQYSSKIGTNFGIENSFYGFSVSQSLLSYGSYSKDFFELTFYGNSDLPSANLSNSNFQAINIQKYEVKFGWQKIDSLTKNIWQFNIAPSFIIGLNYANVNSSDLTLNTTELGTKITLDGELNVEFIDTTKNSTINGYGAGINFGIYHKRNKWQFNLKTNNLGIVNWKNLSINKFDGNYEFNGVQINDIFNINDSLPNQEIFTDSIFETEISNKTKLLPFSIFLSAAYELKEHLYLNSSINIVNAPNYIPQLKTGLYKNKGIFSYGFNIGYGGYTTYFTGLMGGISKNNFNIFISSNNILGFIIPAQTNNQSLNLSLVYSW